MNESKLKVKAIVLDLDGTIVDSREAYLEAARTASAAIGQQTVNIKTVLEIPKRLEQNMPIDDLVSLQDIDKFLEVYLKTYYRITAEKSKPFPNIADTVQALSKKAKLAVATRRHVPKMEVVKELEKFGLMSYFKQVMTSQDTANPKPSPDALTECCRKLRVRAHDCAIVGDSVVDVRAGKNAGAKTVAVLSGIFSRTELEREKPDLIIENLSKLPEFLK